jgi:hypothetical protein
VKKIYSIVIFSYFLISCSTETESSTDRIILDMKEIQSVALSEIANSIDYVFLDRVSDVFVGEVFKVELFQDEYYVFDRRFSNEIFVFNEEGVFQRRIGTKGDGPEEYGEANDFLVLEDRSQLVILDNQEGYLSLIYYSIDGKFIKKISAQLFADLFEFIAPGLFVFYTSNQCNDEFCAAFFTTDLNLEIVDSSIPLVEFYEEFWIEPLRPMGQHNGSVLLTNYGTRFIYKTDNLGRLGIAYEVDFLGRNSNEILENANYRSVDELIKDYSNKNLAFHIEELVALDGGFFFSFQYGKKYVNAFIDQKKDKTYLFERLENDFDFVPFKFSVKGQSENTIFMTINPEEFEFFYALLEKRGEEIPKRVIEIKNRLSLDSNPVIVKIEMSRE